jgi:hypothetical protein
MSVLLAAMLETVAPEVQAVRAESLGPQQRIVVEGRGSLPEVTTRRDGRRLVVSLNARSNADLAAPAAVPPVERIELARVAERLLVTITLDPSVPYRVQREPNRIAILLGAEPDPHVRLGIDALARYRSLFLPREPAPVGDLAPTTAADQPSAGIGIGPLRCEPVVLFGYVDTTSAVVGPDANGDRYFQIEPKLGCRVGVDRTVDVGRARLHAGYTPRVRSFSRIAKINTWSHQVDGGFDLPVGSRVALHGKDHYATGLLEAQEVDPGREYFFDFGRFKRNELSGALDLEIGPRLSTTFGARLNDVRFPEGGGFFSYKQQGVDGALKLHLSEAVLTTLRYTYQRLPPPPTRPIAEATIDSLGVEIGGAIAVFDETSVTILYQRTRAPQAGEGGQRLDDWMGSGRVAKSLARGTRIALSGGRATYPSAHESDAFYVNSSLQGALDLLMPLRFSLRLGVGRLWNDYRAVSVEIDGPRHDRVWAYTAGVGRQLTRWSFLRGDYLLEERQSNIDRFRMRNHTLIVQLGIGLFGATGE